MNIDKTLKENKNELIGYFRGRAGEALTVIKEKFAETESAKRAEAINYSLSKTKEQLITTLLQQAQKENWTNQEKLESVLMITYSHIVVMIESRNSVRPYEYMDFSRRIGELWDPFCQLCFDFPVKDLSLFAPPLFSAAKKKLSDDIVNYIDALNITSEQKKQLKEYYDKVWSLVTSGEIQLELDLHFEQAGQKYVVDFKSGFGSNEKGNLNRLLLVATVYKYLDEDYKCLLFVRADENNSYFNTLKDSGVWEAYCGNQAYQKILEFSGYDLKNWIDRNVNWENDLSKEAVDHFNKFELIQYLKW
jgi:hypothetical protein